MEAIDDDGFDGGVRGDVRSGEEGTIEYPVDETKRRDTRKRENAQSRGATYCPIRDSVCTVSSPSPDREIEMIAVKK